VLAEAPERKALHDISIVVEDPSKDSSIIKSGTLQHNERTHSADAQNP
jgi:hypothetical protein